VLPRRNTRARRAGTGAVRHAGHATARRESATRRNRMVAGEAHLHSVRARQDHSGAPPASHADTAALRRTATTRRGPQPLPILPRATRARITGLSGRLSFQTERVVALAAP